MWGKVLAAIMFLVSVLVLQLTLTEPTAQRTESHETSSLDGSSLIRPNNVSDEYIAEKVIEEAVVEAIEENEPPLVEEFDEVAEILENDLTDPLNLVLDKNVVTDVTQTKPVDEYLNVTYGELLELYATNGYGVVTPETFAGLHMSETTLGTFADDTGISLYDYDESYKDVISSNSSVYKDANGDGYPDGPFQILNGSVLDIWNFRENLLWIVQSISEVRDTYNVKKDHLAMANALVHTRGSFARQLFGVPYDPAGQVKMDSYIEATTDEVSVQLANMLDSIDDQLNEHHPTIVNNDNEGSNAIAIVLLLNDGWFLEKPPSHNMVRKLDSEQGKLALEEIVGITDMLPSEWALTKVLDPRDAVNVSAETYARVYGLGVNEYYSDYYNWDFLYKPLREEAVYNTGEGQIVWAFDYLSLGELVSACYTGENIISMMIEEAGTTDTIRSLYPTYTLSELQANRYTFNKLLNELYPEGISSLRYETLFWAWHGSGSYYVYGGGGRVATNPNKQYAEYYYGSGDPYVEDVLYSKDNYGKRMFDCSSLISYAVSLGNTKHGSSGTLTGTPEVWYTSYGFVDKVSQPDPLGTSVVDYLGTPVDVGLHGVSNGAHSVKDLVSNPDLVEDGLQPGDILALPSHVSFFLWHNDTTETVTLTSDLTRRETIDVAPGDVVTLEAWSKGEINGLRVLEDERPYYVIRPYSYGSVY